MNHPSKLFKNIADALPLFRENDVLRKFSCLDW